MSEGRAATRATGLSARSSQTRSQIRVIGGNGEPRRRGDRRVPGRLKRTAGGSDGAGGAFRQLDSLAVLTTHGFNPAIHIRTWVDPIGPRSKRSRVQIDKLITARRTRIDRVVGNVSAREMLAVDRALAEFLGLKGRRL